MKRLTFADRHSGSLPHAGRRAVPRATAPAVPPGFTEQPLPGAVAPSADWWQTFGSAELSALVAAALQANPDIAIAAERVRQAEAQVQIAGASLFPQVNFGAATSRRETRPDGGSWSTTDGSSAALSASYEIDLWGRNASSLRSAEASLQASRFDFETVRLTLLAGVASGYFDVLSLRGRLAIARAEPGDRGTRAQGRGRSRAQRRGFGARPFAAAGGGVCAARRDPAARAAGAPDAVRARDPARHGRRKVSPPRALGVIALAVPRVAPGLPAELLVRRPDLASAEAQLAAANANVAVARAALLPSISLTGSAGLASDVLLNFLNAPTAALALGASLLQPIFDGGRLRAQVDVAASRERELVENYRRSVLAALADVESALAAGGRTAEQETAAGTGRGAGAARAPARGSPLPRGRRRPADGARRAAHAVPGRRPARADPPLAAAGVDRPVQGARRRLGLS